MYQNLNEKFCFYIIQNGCGRYNLRLSWPDPSSTATLPYYEVGWTMNMVKRRENLFNQKISSRNHTRRTRSKHKWCWISRRRSAGNPRRMASSSTPRVASHLYCTNRRTRCFKSLGSWRCLIHSSVSLRLTLHSSSLKVRDCKYVYTKEGTSKQNRRVKETKYKL